MDIFFGKTENFDVKVFQIPLSIEIAFFCLFVYWTVYFDCQAQVRCKEVNDESVDRFLAVKEITTNLSFSQTLPEKHFREGHVASELLCTEYGSIVGKKESTPGQACIGHGKSVIMDVG